MGSFGWMELLLVVLIVVILFGAGRIAKAGGELGKAIKAFKDGLKGDDDKAIQSEAKDIDHVEKD